VNPPLDAAPAVRSKTNEESPSFSLPHIPVLDGVRGFAIGMVLALHLFTLPYESFGPSLLSRVFHYGWLGVDLFFVLSGFLVTLMLHRLAHVEGGLHLFFRRRVLRILPAYIATLLLAYLVLGPISPTFGLSGEQPSILWFLLASQNYLAITDQFGDWSGLSHYWSLAVEIQFYLLWPLLVYGRPEQSIRRVCAAAFFVAVACKIGFLVVLPDDWLLSYALPLTRIDAFAAGGLAAMIHSRQGTSAPSPGLMALFLCVLLGGIYLLESGELGEHSRIVLLTPAAAAAFMCAIIWLTSRRSAASPFRRFLESRFLSSLGKYSYGMYLLHFIALAHVGKATRWLAASWNIDVNFALTLSGAVVAVLTWFFARLMFVYVEQPFLRLR
jgi:peptidoglycan/LPS O-acetylase OafA/YrhL